ncbi:uncharacterized protein conserved in bacteria [Longilinea arvoryzae]|uniref:Uncharacterized protein conserved in bacteria n=1 Tax=Longilinea arvoryzae TaxID=360412 RepID=A0A0S7B8Q6_9CHLR|nr:DUF1343 domain-containing protein [Longilinea arvoryzae]GAP13735.1 uncharacterized protein conserved in bacteria [Longilinea arvoryzae]
MMVRSGLEGLLAENCRSLKGRRVGLIGQSAAVLPDFTHGLDALLRAGVNVTALFGPEHGFRGAAADGASVENQRDPKTGLPVYSLYGPTRQPTNEMLASVDALVFDMQDVGVRFYTYLSTLFYGMKGAAAAGMPFWVLDRPNPLGGLKLAGPLVAPGFESFIGVVRIPIMYGLTLGELAGWMNATYHLGADLRLAPMKGWTRSMSFEQTGLPWVPTSPAMPHLSTVRVYPGTCLIEGTNLSEGRGTALPFEVVGAPWLDGEALADSLNQLDLAGVRFRPVAFSPTASKFAGTTCFGVQLHVSQAQAFQPVETGLHVIAACRAQNPEQFKFLETSWEGRPAHFDLAIGNSQVREQIEVGAPVDEICQSWRAELAEFERDCAAYLRYA